ncbi:hypothetical protein Bca4012_006326 [Brassica carinata]|uniref:BnaC03g74890D protein n=1 Tax=Brassica napus TaxID=3708 RepID=A0A078ISD9_BRANA|nr:BnaC03g74890D [Brassica napus]
MFMNTTTYIEDCRPLLFNISSNGIWENLKSPDVIFGYSLPLMEIQILLIFTSVVMAHMFLRCIGISHIASYMIAGLIMGPQLFDLREKSTWKLSLDPIMNGNGPLRSFSACGFMMFSFLMSLRTSRRVVFNNGPLPVVIGILTFIVPLVVGLCFRNVLDDNINPHYMPPKKALAERTVIIATQSSILLPTITYFLSELNILNSEFGRLALSASVINDILGVSFIVLAMDSTRNTRKQTCGEYICACCNFNRIGFCRLHHGLPYEIRPWTSHDRPRYTRRSAFRIRLRSQV